MKSIKLLSTVFALLFATIAFAQDIPKKEFTVSVADKNINLLPGETKEIDVNINRSKSYRKIDIDLAIASILPQGVTVEFENGADPMTQRIMKVSAATDALPFEKTIILKAKSSRVNKAIMLKMSLDATTLSSN